MSQYRVMQIMETGEECCPVDDVAYDEAEHWIDTNKDEYPESAFYIEEQIDYHTGRRSTAPNLQNIPIRTVEGRRIRAAFIK